MKRFLYLLAAIISAVAIMEPPAAAGPEWVLTGKGDCSGRDAHGLTVGSQKPEASLCNESFRGKTAVCWDGTSMKHWGSDKPQCTYKNIEPANCKGGGSPGFMYECRDAEDSGDYAWILLSKGDCSGRDVQPLSKGSAMPRPELCNAAFAGKTAVCWDGMAVKHWGSDVPQCTYKNIEPAKCSGGGSPGYLYECRKSGMYVWKQVKRGDCSGRDVQPLSKGSAMPRPELCSAAFAGKTAVCWDGNTLKHWGSDVPQCTYKNVDPANCSGGGSPGFMYECVAR